MRRRRGSAGGAGLAGDPVGVPFRFHGAAAGVPFGGAAAIDGDDSEAAPPDPTMPNPDQLLLWYDGEDIDGSNNSTLSHGGAVATWVNKGSYGAAHNMSAAGNPTAGIPIASGKLNGAAGVILDGVADSFGSAATGMDLDHPIKVAIVARMDDRGAAPSYGWQAFIDGSLGRFAVYRYYAGGASAGLKVFAGAEVTPGFDVTWGEYSAWILTADANEVDVQKNDSAPSSVLDSGGQKAPRLTVGDSWDRVGGACMKGAFALICVWEEPHPTNAAILEYLQFRFGAFPQ